LEYGRRLLWPLLTSQSTKCVTTPAPPFEPSPTRGYTSEISPNKGRDLSLPKLPIYLRSFFRFGFAVSSPLAWSRRPRMRFLFVTWQVLAGRCPATILCWLTDHLRRLPLHGLSPRRSCPRLVLSFVRNSFGILTPGKKPELSTGDFHPTRSRPCWAYCNGAAVVRLLKWTLNSRDSVNPTVLALKKLRGRIGARDLRGR